MAFVNSYIQLNLRSGGSWNFANLNYASYYYGGSGSFSAVYGGYESDNFWGYGFKYDSYGRPTGAGTVTEYLSMNDYGYTNVYAEGLAIPAASILAASRTFGVGDDLKVIKSALAGHDTIYGSDFADVLDGFSGNDYIRGYNGNDQVFGSAGNDTLDGGTGADYINGGTGADRMLGSAGNDTFIVDNAGDKITEISGQGTDKVYTAVSFVLAGGTHVEALATTSPAGTQSINIFGNEVAQTITGNNGANTLYGGGGNDILKGAAGNDLLYGTTGNDILAGGAGKDAFIFNNTPNPTNVDRIIDFSVADDTIRLENAVMPGLGRAVGTLSAAAFWKSASGAAHDSNDRIIYETDTGALFYDANGSAPGGAVQIATLGPHLALNYGDFLVI